eukprot:1159814-Pelagomonas_calceolata.AAC.2
MLVSFHNQGMPPGLFLFRALIPFTIALRAHQVLILMRISALFLVCDPDVHSIMHVYSSQML